MKQVQLTEKISRKESDKMKLIAIDLDGTLLNNAGELSVKTIETIGKVQEAGHKVVIATGRHLYGALPIAAKLALQDGLICFNGALVYNLQKFTADYALTYTKDDIINLVSLIKTWGYDYYATTANRFIIESEYVALINELTEKGIPLKEVANLLEFNQPILKTTVAADKEKMDQIERYVPNTVPGLHVVRSSEESIDVMSSQASKGKAVQLIANRFQIKQEDIITFGNYDNDISMLKFAGVGVAMDNAPDHVKKHADIITYSNEADGVANYLTENVLRRPMIRSFA